MKRRRSPKYKPEFHHILLECNHVIGVGIGVRDDEFKCPTCGEWKRVKLTVPW